MSDSYKPISTYYNLLSGLYSLGRIPKCRGAILNHIITEKVGGSAKNTDVFFAGVGHGEEAISVARSGAEVTVADTSSSMLDSFLSKLANEDDEVKLRVKVINDDVRNVVGKYDWVVANFFLNVFEQAEMLEMLDSLTELCVDKGNLVIGDFCYDRNGGILTRSLQRLNWYLALMIFRMFVKNGRHPVFNYKDHLRERKWGSVEERGFGFLGVILYRSIRFKKSCNKE